MMRIVIDLQGAQTASRFRGIGRYTNSLIRAMIAKRNDNEVIIALNGLFIETIEPIRNDFIDFLPDCNIQVWNSIEPVCGNDLFDDKRRKIGELLYESFLLSLSPDIILISSLFEGYDENAITSIGNLGKFVPVAVILYDLIPLIYRDTYLQNSALEHWYETKLDHLRRADLLLAISHSSAHEAIEYLGIPEEMVVTISTACDTIFHPMVVKDEQYRVLNHSYGIAKPFVLYTGGVDQRKNISGLLQAFSQLPLNIRTKYQLVLVGRELLTLRGHFMSLAFEYGLKDDQVVFTGYIGDNELALLYNTCNLFVFPSWHEGFGLPVLEAMSCGRATIGANISSIPEVIGREDALFDPHDDSAIRDKMLHVLTDDAFRTELEQHGLERSKIFSWDESAKRAIEAFENLHRKKMFEKENQHQVLSVRPRMAYISPLPPERSGISDYSAELLPELSRHYQIDVIIAQDSISDPWIKANCSIRTVEWFREHSSLYDRILYHFGNSPFHQHMFNLLEEHPGVVVLHDFYLGQVVTHMDGLRGDEFLNHTLYHSHGYRALQERFEAENVWDLAWKYPCNKMVLDNAQGIIVHSENSYRLAQQWYGVNASKHFSLIPHLRSPENKIDKPITLEKLGFKNDDFIVCSFGLLGESKLNHRLLHAWLGSKLATNKSCHLIFVGENDTGSYGEELITTIKKSSCSNRIHITGWADTEKFHHYLAIADIGVQLRTLSRGETSGTVLDCMNYGVATIVNAHGSMADLPDDGVLKLSDKFTDKELQDAIEKLYEDSTARDTIGKRAKEIIRDKHNPRFCAEQYKETIEKSYKESKFAENGLINAINKLEGQILTEENCLKLANAIAQNQTASKAKQLLIDISAIVSHDLKTGIQRVVRSILDELLKNQPIGYRVEPIYATANQAGYRYARQFTLNFLDCSNQFLIDEPVEVVNGDTFLGLDLQPDIVPQQIDFYTYLMRMGVKVYFMIYDLLPVLQPKFFPEGSFTGFSMWLNAVAKANGAVCISRAVADEMSEWMNSNTKRSFPFTLGWFHLGADLESSLPTTGFPSDSTKVLNSITDKITFLMVGTIEPRKGYLQTILAFEELWAQGIDVNLVIVGNEGWKPLLDNARRTIPQIVTKIKNNKQLNHRLFWLEGISDEYLEKVYATSTCLIGASEGEGFGLPLIEAAQHKIPMILRDIPVFREVAGKYAYYFDNDNQPKVIAKSIKEWLNLYKAKKHPKSDDMPWLTWKQSTKQLVDVLMGQRHYKQWLPPMFLRYWGGDHRLGTQVGERSGKYIYTTREQGFLIFGPYAKLEKGYYRIQIEANIVKFGHSRVDVVANGSLDQFYQSQLKDLSSGAVQTLATVGKDSIYCFDIKLDREYSDVEVRIWVDEATDMTLGALQISRLYE